MVIYLLAAAETAALTLALVYRFARQSGYARQHGVPDPGLVALALAIGMAWIITIPLAIAGVVTDAFRYAQASAEGDVPAAETGEE
jgi:hypothetical protein